MEDSSFRAVANWRSLLFVPAMVEKFVENAKTSRADGVVIDLEDSVLLKDKDEARARVKEIARRLKAERRDVIVRINRPLSLAVRDIEMAIGPDVDAIMVAKASGAEHLALLAEVVSQKERALGLQRRTSFVPLLETPEAIARLTEICKTERVVAVVCGDEDLATELGCQPTSETITNIKFQLVLAAARAGVLPLGLIGTIAEFRDTVTYQGYLERSRDAGLKGTLCIHPSQVDLANEAFLPTEAEIRHARRVIAAAAEAEARGAAAVALDGAMIDPPVVRRASLTLARLPK